MSNLNCNFCKNRPAAIGWPCCICTRGEYFEPDPAAFSDILPDTPPADPDPVDHPDYYNDGKIEVIDYIEDQKLGFCLGNAVKYISRAGKKDKAKEVEDLKKAAWYVNRRIEELTKCNT